MMAAVFAPPRGRPFEQDARIQAPGAVRGGAWKAAQDAGVREARDAAIGDDAQTQIAQLRDANRRLLTACHCARRRLDEAEAANRLKDEFVAAVAHELRTPLNAVLGWTRLLELHQLPPDRAARAVTAIARSSCALANIVDDLLDRSRILNGTLRMAKERVDIVGVVQFAMDAVRPSAEAKGVQLVLEASSGRRTVTGDAGRLQQVIWNLLANAIKFTPGGGRVSVLVEPSADHVEIRVVDTGAGICADFLPHVFERYRQADGAPIGRHTGLGLGLGIVLSLVELHGGSVHAASAGPGTGATFTVRLPLASEAAGSEQRE